MRKYTPLLIFILAFCYQDVFAQANRHNDSVKAFLKDWIQESEFHKDPSVLEYAVYESFDSMLRRDWAETLDNERNLKIYKKILRSNGIGKSITDSISLDDRELTIIRKLIRTPHFTWTTETLQDVKIVKQKIIDSLFNKAQTLSRDADNYDDDYLSGKLADGSKAKNYRDSLNAIYTSLEKGFWAIIPPLFIRKGTLAIFYSAYIHGHFYGSFGLDVYRSRDEKWEYFGNIISANMN